MNEIKGRFELNFDFKLKKIIQPYSKKSRFLLETAY